jgi:hypothetical protein
MGLSRSLPARWLRENGTEGLHGAGSGTESPGKVPKDVRQAFLAGGDPPPQNETAASTGIEGGGGNEYDNAGERLPDFYRTHPILATHFGLGDGR